jgi:hypothetical protein
MGDVEKVDWGESERGEWVGKSRAVLEKRIAEDVLGSCTFAVERLDRYDSSKQTSSRKRADSGVDGRSLHTKKSKT